MLTAALTLAKAATEEQALVGMACTHSIDPIDAVSCLCWHQASLDKGEDLAMRPGRNVIHP
ncbi:hypothetical protein HCU64_20915 [Methylobacterium sp. C25]|uniref:hypothetical protein n=1 Tax=Methylobacterium sp. C25 TaxID=2721622 RepID=UPI001F27CD47|nr:hypothetical protein [Methylobacterium sp. C25]MCE4226216.1 hypothetical protein [Methylobacterium sp. C25]